MGNHPPGADGIQNMLNEPSKMVGDRKINASNIIAMLKTALSIFTGRKNTRKSLCLWIITVIRIAPQPNVAHEGCGQAPMIPDDWK